CSIGWACGASSAIADLQPIEHAAQRGADPDELLAGRHELAMDVEEPAMTGAPQRAQARDADAGPGLAAEPGVELRARRGDRAGPPGVAGAVHRVVEARPHHRPRAARVAE